MRYSARTSIWPCRIGMNRSQMIVSGSRAWRLVEERLAEYRRTNVFVFDMFIDADDDSTDGPPNLWIARDHYTGELIQRLTGAELEGFYTKHENWVEYSGLVDELQDKLKYEP